jgi:hypothetical protein
MPWIVVVCDGDGYSYSQPERAMPVGGENLIWESKETKNQQSKE